MNTVMPIPPGAPPIPDHPTLGTPVALWAYRDLSGAPVFYICRFEPNGRKVILPLSFAGGSWSWSMPDLVLRPLYGLPALAANPDSPVLLVEGEKTADAAANLFSDFVVVTTSGGSSAIGKTDFSPLHDRTVTTWPDHDDAGRKYAAAAADHLYGVDATVFTVDVPDDWPDKWDLADPPPDGADLRSMLEQARPAETPRSVVDRIRDCQSLDELEGPLRDLKVEWKALDAIGRRLLRERSVSALKEARVEVGAAAKLIDAALGSEAEGVASLVSTGTLVLADQAPWDEPVDGIKLLDDIRAQFLRYLVLRPGCDVAVTLWTIHAHALDASFNSPRLTITSPIPECGKTTLCNVLAKLTPRPYRVINPTPATMYRVIDVYSPTTFIDEADNIDFFENRDLMSIIDAGFDRDSAAVPRCVGEDLEVRLFSVWCPLVLAQAKRRLPPQIESRSIVIPMDRIGPGEHVEHLRPDRVDHLVDLNRKSVRWVTDHLAELKAADPAMPPGLRSRRIDKWRSLFAVADAVGGTWPEIARKAAIALESGDRDDNASWSVLALRDLEDMFRDQRVGVLTSEQIVKHFATMDTRPWVEYRHGKPITQRQLAALLGTFDIKPQTVRVGPGTAKGYRLEACRDVFTRYRGVHDPSQRHNADDDYVFLGGVSVTQEEHVTDRDSGKVNADGNCGGVTDRTGGSGKEDRDSGSDDVEYF